MTTFNNDDYLSKQVNKQVKERVQSSCKLKLETRPYDLNFDLLDCSIKDLQDMVKSKIITYEDITKYYLNRIHLYKHYNSVLEINDQALLQAKEKYYSDQHSPLYGIPILIKANIGDKSMTTTAGAAAMEGFVCDDDAKVVKSLLEQGAIILGKTNLSEWANFMSTESSNGYSALGGQTVNPYGAFDVGGSSSGSAVATICQLAPVTLGTETAGSIIYPASQNGVVGLKPTLGLVAIDHIIPISKSHDTAGPMGKTVEDVTCLFAGMINKKEIKTFDKNVLKNKKIGLIINDAVTSYYRLGDQDILDEIITKLRSLKASVEEFYLDESAFDTKVYDILKYEFRQGVKNFMTYDKHHKMSSLDDVVTFNKTNMSKYAPYNQEIIEQSIHETYDDKTIVKQLEINQTLTRQALDKAFESFDILMTLSNYATSVYAPAGYPAINLPGHYRESGEPIGLTFIGRLNEDISLLEYAYSYEQSTSRRQPILEKESL